MSLYIDYVKDFPGRILNLYKKNHKSTEHDHLEVTFLVSLTASAIAIPLDRLRPENNRQFPDPFHNREREFKEAGETFDKIYKKNFRDCELWDDIFDEWKQGTCNNANSDPDSWPREKINNSYTFKELIHHLRNSLAHGTLRTSGDKLIEKIVLLTGREEDGLKFLIVTPNSLEIFLHKWVDWLEQLPKSPLKRDREV